MQRANLDSYSRIGTGEQPQGTGGVARPATDWRGQREKLIAILGSVGERRFKNENRVTHFVRFLEAKGARLADHAEVKRLFGEYAAMRRARAAEPAKTEHGASAASSAPPEPIASPAPVAAIATNADGLREMFKTEKTFDAMSPATIAKFIAFVEARHIDPADKDLVASLLPPFLEEIEKAAPPTARALIAAVEADDAEQVAQLLDSGVDPARTLLRPDRPPNRSQLQDLGRLASDYDSAPAGSRAYEFAGHAFKVLPSLTTLNRPKHPGRNMLTLALACKAGKAVETICLWVERQRQAGDAKACKVLDRSDGQGCTPLILAIEIGDEACVELLLKHGADVDQPNTRPSYDYTPLMIAIAKKNGAAVNQLLKRGANPLFVEREGDSALSLAIEAKDISTQKLLLEAMPDHLAQAARAMKEERTRSCSSESEARLAKALTDLDDVMDAAEGSGDEELQTLARPCRDLAHQSQPDVSFEALFLQIDRYKKLSQQDPTGARTDRLRASICELLRRGPEEWARRFALTSKWPEDGPLHSEELDRFYTKVSALAGVAGSAEPVDSELRDLADACIVQAFDCCSDHGNVQDGAKLLVLMLRAARLNDRCYPDAALKCVQRTDKGLRDHRDASISGNQLVASLVTAEVAILELKIKQEYAGLRSYVDHVDQDADGRDVTRNDFVSEAVRHLRGVSSKGSAVAAAGMFLDAFRIVTRGYIETLAHEGSLCSPLTRRCFYAFYQLSPRGQRHALKQMNPEEFAILAAVIAEWRDDPAHRSFLDTTSTFKAVQEFQQGRPYAPASDDALFGDIINQIHDIETKHVGGQPDLRTKAVGEAISRRIRQFIGKAYGEGLIGWLRGLPERDAMAQTLATVLSLALPPNARMAALQALSPQDLLTVRSWFDEENDTTRPGRSTRSAPSTGRNAGEPE